MALILNLCLFYKSFSKFLSRLTQTVQGELCPHNLDSTELVAPAELLALGNGLCISCVRFPQHVRTNTTQHQHCMRWQRPPGHPTLCSWNALYDAGFPFIKAAVAARVLLESSAPSRRPHARRRSRTSESAYSPLAPCASCIRQLL